MRKYYAILFILLFTMGLKAQQKIFINSDDIQEYKGKIGKWFLIDSKKSLMALSKRFSSDIDEIYSLNNIGSQLLKSYYFIPYSVDYLDVLEKKNIQIKFIISNEEEFIWPVTNAIETSSVLGFRNGKFHTGLDLPILPGKPVIASMEGLVIYSGYDDGYGRVIVIEHRNNFTTKYAHNYVNLVKNSDFVKKGQIIGLVGSTGNSTGNHLHFEIRCKNIPLDPLDFLPQRNDLHILHTLKNWK